MISITSTSITLIITLGSSIQQLHDNACDLLYAVESVVEAKETLGLTFEVREKCGDSLTTALASATIVGAEVRTLLATIVPSIISRDHAYAKGLRQFSHSVNAFLTVGQRIMATQINEIAQEKVREDAMRKQATDLEFSLLNMLQFLRDIKYTISDIKHMVESQESNTASNINAATETDL